MTKLRIVPRTGAGGSTVRGAGHEPGGVLASELSSLRGMISLMEDEMLNDPPVADKVRISGSIARLSDSVVRALLAAAKLESADDEMEELRADIKRIFREIGWGES